MQVPVPQFIDVEDKIIGPFTLKQFGFIFAGGLLIAAFFRIFHLSVIFFLLALPVAIIFAGVAFGSFNGRHIYQNIPVFLQFAFSPKVLVFHRDKTGEAVVLANPAVGSQPQAPQGLSQSEQPSSRLKKLSLLLDQKNQEELEEFKQS